VGPFFVWFYGPLIESNFILALILGSLFLSAGFLSASGIYEAVAERFSRFFNFKYGQARAWGSFGYAISALAAGFLFVINPSLNFWLGSILGLILLLILVFWKSKDDKNIEEAAKNEDSEASAPKLKMFGLLSYLLCLLGHSILFMINKCSQIFIQNSFHLQKWGNKCMGL